jgi:hypothetical protein
MHLSKFVHSTTGRYMMSILLGIGLATIFRETCVGANCVTYNAPPIEELDEQTYKFDGKCYKMEQNSVNCDAKKKIYNFV